MAENVAEGSNRTVEYPHVVRGMLCAFGGAACWGFSGTCAQLLTDSYGIPVAWITCVRMLLAAVLFLAVVSARNHKALLAVLRDTRSLLRIAGFGLLGVLLTQVSYLSAIAYTNAGIGTVLERLGLIVIMFFTCWKMWRLPKLRELAGLVLALGGTFLIATKGQIGSLSIPIEGLLFGILSAFALAFYTLMPVKPLKKWGPFVVTGLAMLMGGVVACVIFQPWNIQVDVTPSVVGVLAAMVLVGTLGAYVLYLQGVTDAGPVRASLIGCMEPVSATVISAVWLGTPVVPVDILGIALILAMVPFVTQRQTSGAKREGGEIPMFRGRASELGYLTTHVATQDNYDEIIEILNDGHAYLEELGVEQGNKKYPSFRALKRAISKGNCYVVRSQDGHNVAVFSVDFERERQYKEKNFIVGHWANDTKPGDPGYPDYAVLRWVTVLAQARRRGVGSFILGEADRIAREHGARSICGDTYPENYPMREALLQHGYVQCGKLKIGAPVVEPDRVRLAFEKMLR